MRTRILSSLATAAVVVGVLFAAPPAYADHNAGGGLYDAAGGPTSCYAGASTRGTPPADISTAKWKTFERSGRLHLVCWFTVPMYMPADDYGLGDYKGEWHAPTTPTVSIHWNPNCLPPGVDAASETWPDDEARPVPKSKTKVVAYRTSIVMYCSWPLADLP